MSLWDKPSETDLVLDANSINKNLSNEAQIRDFETALEGDAPVKLGDGTIGWSAVGAQAVNNSILFAQEFTGDGVSNIFQLSSSINNGSFTSGSWIVSRIQNTFPSEIVGSANLRPLYDSDNIFNRNRITIQSISSGGLVTLNNIPQDTVTFKVYYWYTLEGTERISNYYVDNIVAESHETNNELANYAKSIQFQINQANPTHAEGLVFYDQTKKALSYYNEASDVTINLAQELLFVVENQTGETLLNGTVISPDITTIITKADANIKSKCRLIAVLTHDIPDGETGYATKLGQVGDLDTSSYAEGTILYLSETTPGTFTDQEPTDGSYNVVVGVVDISDASEGVITVDTRTSDLTVEVNDLNGFTNAERDASEMSFDNLTRTFTIEPTGDMFHYYQVGNKYEITEAQNLEISNIEGLHLIYFDGFILKDLINGTGEETSNIIRNKTLVAYLYWDTDNQELNYFGDERHGLSMSAVTHNYLHFTRGAQYGNGLALGDFQVDGTGNDNADAQFSVARGSIYDEDFFHNISAVLSTTGLPVYYLDGADGNMRRQVNAGFPVLNDVGGTERLLYNEWTGTTWQLTPLNNNTYGLYHIFAINGLAGETQIISIMGLNQYGNLSSAQAGAGIELSEILSKIPIYERTPIGTVIYQTSNNYSNDVKARIREESNGQDYTDWRTTGELGSSGTFESSDGKVITVTNGIISNIETI